LESGAFAVTVEGRIAVFRPRAGDDLSALPRERVEAIQGFKPDHDALARAGYAARVAPEGEYATALILLPRAKAEARALVAEAAAHLPKGAPIAVDGQKHDGIDSFLKDLRARAALGEPIAKAHGKIAVFANPGSAAFADWKGAALRGPHSYATHPAAFSADAPDPGSVALAAVLPADLQGVVADFGAGWGYLSGEALKRPGVTEMHLIEAEHAALEAARENIADPRARFHWADATAEAPYDAILMNPPFHRGREADPALGRAFIAAAAKALRPSGVLYMVANRQLPYEHALAEAFAEVEPLPGPPAYKLTRASRPRRTRR
jgi:16S rRNA (guanine1207-N2)-methyltransferase